jgi:hypothetical protein
MYRGQPVTAIAGEVVLEFKPDVSSDQRRRIASSLGLSERLFLRHSPLGAYTILSGQSVEDVISAALKVDGVANAGPSAAAQFQSCSPACGEMLGACAMPDDALYPARQLGDVGWTDIDRAWNDPAIYGSRSNPDITIWVLDSGIDPRHPDLVDKLLRDGYGKAVGFITPGFSGFQEGNGHGDRGCRSGGCINERSRSVHAAARHVL